MKHESPRCKSETLGIVDFDYMLSSSQHMLAPWYRHCYCNISTDLLCFYKLRLLYHSLSWTFISNMTTCTTVNISLSFSHSGLKCSLHLFSKILVKVSCSFNITHEMHICLNENLRGSVSIVTMLQPGQLGSWDSLSSRGKILLFYTGHTDPYLARTRWW